MKYWETLYTEYHYEQLNSVVFELWGHTTILDIWLMKDESIYARFQITFAECNFIQTSIQSDIEVPTELIDIQIGEANYVAPAIIYTGSIEMKIKYKTVSVERMPVA